MRALIITGIALAIGAAAYFGIPFAQKAIKWRQLDQTYEEEFPSPAAIATALKGKRLLFHMKTPLEKDDSQICVGFNIVLAAIEAGADVNVLFDAGATADLQGNLASTKVPVRLQKIIAAQTHLPLEQMPDNYRDYLELLRDRGAKIQANTAMLIVTGDAEQVQQPLVDYPFIETAPYAREAELFAEADTVLVY